MVKKYLLFFIVIITTFLFSFQKTNELNSIKTYFNSDLLFWKNSFSNFKLEDFKKVDEFSFENIKSGEFKNLNNFYSIYKPLLSFSKDKTKFIDIYSSQLGLVKEKGQIVSYKEIDQEISLVDLKNKTWNRILFCGSTSWIDEITWINNTKFILVGIKQDEKGNKKPIIYIGNTNIKSLEVYENNNVKCYQTIFFQSEKLKKLKIRQNE